MTSTQEGDTNSYRFDDDLGGSSRPSFLRSIEPRARRRYMNIF